ncbi:PREDICTED: B3 domain-containing protein At3g11580-like [Tarenaya hassleriana]|uniref:B3 domain-containing protein At3g11580-like n=1 Tax=Tarenaya hassleriana TaxID=28532 RepID=UPI00053C9D1E|nr:PREDICTED: B3 domain-containing protein At3g11580-like [Tarenaya hassleriana]
MPYRQLPHQVHASSYDPHSGTAAMAEAQSPAMGPSSRTVRLFGVNLECQLDRDDDVATTTVVEPPCRDGYGYGYGYGDGDVSAQLYYYPHSMNISFSEDTMKQTRDRRG